MWKPSKTALFDAAKAWDAASVEALLEASPDLAQATDPKGRTALHLACGVRPTSPAIGEPNGLKTVAALLKAGGVFGPVDLRGGFHVVRNFPRPARLPGPPQYTRRAASVVGRAALGPIRTCQRGSLVRYRRCAISAIFFAEHRAKLRS